jgi:hypothetical protein
MVADDEKAYREVATMPKCGRFCLLISVLTCSSTVVEGKVRLVLLRTCFVPLVLFEVFLY